MSYELVIFLQTLGDLKRSILLSLAHIYPRQVSIPQLSLISGYSRNSKYIYRSGAVDELKDENFIEVTKISGLQLVQLNPNSPLIQELIELCTSHGSETTTQLLTLLKEDSE